ncbi:MAG TPA: hypothetical protein VIX73_31655 [Kofleriaceae bacterium]|jgi:hypothetical protein
MGSYTSNTSKDWRNFTSTQMRQLAGTVRRMAVGVTNVLSGVGTTTASFWQVVGHLLLDNTTRETADAEVFSGVGFYARPPAGANAEAIVAFPGGPSNPVVVASRDEATRKKSVGAANQDETYVYNSQVVLRLSNSGLIQAFLIGGPTPVALALLSDVQGVVSAYNGHTHAVAGGTAAAVVPTQRAPAPVGSSVLRG